MFIELPHDFSTYFPSGRQQKPHKPLDSHGTSFLPDEKTLENAHDPSMNTTSKHPIFLFVGGKLCYVKYITMHCNWSILP